MIKFKVLAIKAEINDMHIIFLLKKNIRTNIIKIILGYSPMITPEILKKWKMAIILVLNKNINLHKVNMTIKQKQKQQLGVEEHPWTLENPETTLTKIRN